MYIFTPQKQAMSFFGFGTKALKQYSTALAVHKQGILLVYVEYSRGAAREGRQWTKYL